MAVCMVKLRSDLYLRSLQNCGECRILGSRSGWGQTIQEIIGVLWARDDSLN